ncbi:polyribonucleotide nucleotidyltransferase [Candidatus Uhrbacteria bacterium]|nr:polyribonucleotide nucleotidyltransferase [Candidatus Uhrbacteria bacterium]
MSQQYSAEIGGRTMTIEVGKFAWHATASVTVRYGDTVVLATVVMSKAQREGIDFFPLMVEYEERLYAAGKIKGSRFIKRETRPSDEAVLAARMIDRAIRPLFDDRLKNDVQVVLTILSVDGENDPDIPSFIAATTALAISNLPWKGPIAGIRIGQINNEWVINPTYAAREKSTVDLVIGGTPERLLMIEADANEVPEATVAEAIAFGQKHLREVIQLIEEVAGAHGQPKITLPTPEELEDVLVEGAKVFVRERMPETLFSKTHDAKKSRKDQIDLIKKELEAKLIADSVGKDKRKSILAMVYGWIEEEVTRAILEEGRRVDGRALTQIRPLNAEVGLLPRTHGSGLFERGETQVLSVVTLGSPSEEQTLEGIEGNGKKRYMHHYNFPPYSVGEASPMRSTSRREIGHGMLAEKALVPVLPPKEQFPYTVRVVSEVLSSNGSSSMASTCGSTLALMDAGVPIKAPVAGIAMGLASDNSGRYKILTDLQDLEDGEGGMDFKVTGTRKGITAVQLDTKTEGLTKTMVDETLAQALTARMQILDVMEAVLAQPRPELSEYAPRVVTIHIPVDKIRDVIGPGGKMINEIIDTLGVTIDIEQDGTVFVTGVNSVNVEKAVTWIKNLTRKVEAGEIFEGKVTRIMDFGAFVEVLPKQEGLVHISELAHYRVNKVTDVVNLGDMVKVRVKEIDDLGRINLSMKALTEETPEDRAKRDADRQSGGGGFRSSGPRPFNNGPRPPRRNF